MLAEDKDGIFIHPASKWTLRTEANDDANFDLLVTKFGQPAPDEIIEFQECLGVFSEGPDVGIPELTLPSPVNTNEDGLASVTIATLNPGTSRGYIDGQLYGFCYGVQGSRAPDPSSLDNVIVVRLYDAYPDVTSPTWLDHIYPIFKQYAELYPVMTENFVDLGNYYDVQAKKVPISKTIGLPLTHPNYMPVTRDLSRTKTDIVLKWLATDDLPVGEWKKTYSLDQLKKDLQTALQIEHATIPTYLTAFATIKNVYNSEVQSVFKTVLVQEMVHMALVSNILNAIGGEPKLYFDGFVPQYPSHLPGGVQPELAVPIEKCSLALIRNVFMKIEQPMEFEENPVSDIIDLPERPEFSQIHGPCPSFDHSCHVFRSANGLSTSTMVWAGEYQTTNNFKNILPSFVHPSNSIGAFYAHIRDELEHLGADGSIFTGTMCILWLTCQYLLSLAVQRVYLQWYVPPFQSLSESFRPVVNSRRGLLQGVVFPETRNATLKMFWQLRRRGVTRCKEIRATSTICDEKAWRDCRVGIGGRSLKTKYTLLHFMLLERCRVGWLRVVPIVAKSSIYVLWNWHAKKTTRQTKTVQFSRTDKTRRYCVASYWGGNRALINQAAFESYFQCIQG